MKMIRRKNAKYEKVFKNSRINFEPNWFQQSAVALFSNVWTQKVVNLFEIDNKV